MQTDSVISNGVPEDSNGKRQVLMVQELPKDLEPLTALKRLSHLPYPVFLDSSLENASLGNTSYVAADPFRKVLSSNPDVQQFQVIDQWLSEFHSPALEGFPAFQGGVINFCSYDLKSCFESIPQVADEFGQPQLFAGCYDVVLAFDHLQHRAWLFSTGFPEMEPNLRRQRGESRMNQFMDWLRSDSSPVDPGERGAHKAALNRSDLLPQFDSGISSRVTSDFSKPAYIAAVQRCIDYIYAGDVFQVNLSQRLLAPQTAEPLLVYEKLRQQNPAPFGAYLDLGVFQVLSSSPERLLSIDSRGNVETRPIKGTRQRSCYPEANLFLAEGLITSEKDRSENVMIVDLLRNDLAKICDPDSIFVSQLCGLEEYEFVQHLVSVIHGRIKKETSFSRLFSAVFPGGSITGAPKVRAMEIIAEIEPTTRGGYCGSLGYFGWDGAVDQNILIRTIMMGRGWCQIPVGGGIVAQSDPLSEYNETVHKAHGMIRALT